MAIRTTGPVRVPKAAELVAARIRGRIVRGELGEGDTLPSEAELTAQFGVSRPTLREALRILESQSLISVGRGTRGGAKVHLPGLEVAAEHTGLLLQVRQTTLADLYQARIILIAPAARLLAEGRTQADLKRLRQALTRLASLADDPPAFLGAAASFNLLLLELCGNTTLAVLAGMVNDIVNRHLESVVQDWVAHPRHAKEAERVCRAIAELIDMIEQRRGAEAEEFWREQMDQSARYTLDHFGPRTVVDLLE